MYSTRAICFRDVSADASRQHAIGRIRRRIIEEIAPIQTSLRPTPCDRRDQVHTVRWDVLSRSAVLSRVARPNSPAFGNGISPNRAARSGIDGYRSAESCP